MNTLRAALVPGLIAGVISIFTSWLWMAVVFHRYQRATPNTWRAESGRSYLLSILLHLIATIGIACLFTLMVRFNVSAFAPGIGGSLRFALAVSAAVSLPIILERAVFVNLHPLVVIGELLDWLTTSVLACAMTAWWLGR